MNDEKETKGINQSFRTVSHLDFWPSWVPILISRICRDYCRWSCNSVVLSWECALESPGGFVPVQIDGPYSQSFWFSLSGVGFEICICNPFPGDTGVAALWPQSENRCHNTQRNCAVTAFLLTTRFTLQDLKKNGSITTYNVKSALFKCDLNNLRMCIFDPVVDRQVGFPTMPIPYGKGM